MSNTHSTFCLQRLIALSAVACAVFGTSLHSQTHALTQVYSNNDFQLTGVSVSKSGRLFVNFPRWSDKYENAVVEVLKDGSVKPYPNNDWNRWDNKPSTAGNHFVCVQSIVADDAGSLWIVDAAAPLLSSVVPGGAKLVRVDLASNQVTKVFSFGPDVAKSNSYLNDIRIDTKRNFAYMTDSGAAGIIVLDIQAGTSHRALDGHPSVMVEKGVSITVNNKPVIGPTGQPPQFASDGIALSPDGEFLYYQALTGATLYRVKTSVLRDANAQPDTVAASVETVAKTFPVDGLWIDPQNRLYLSKLSENAVYRMSTSDRRMEKLVSDPRLVWPDTFSQGPDGAVYITASHINEGPTYNHGKSTRTQPYMVFKFMP